MQAGATGAIIAGIIGVGATVGIGAAIAVTGGVMADIIGPIIAIARAAGRNGVMIAGGTAT
jgi:hypothetical protein